MEFKISGKPEQRKRTARIAARLGLLAMGAVFASGSLSFSGSPARPSVECWESISQTNAVGGHLPISLVELLKNDQATFPPRAESSEPIVSAALDANPKKIFEQELDAGVGRFETIQSGTLIGGIELQVRRDEDLPINIDALNSMLLQALNAEYDDPVLQAHMWCFRRDLLDKNLFEGEQMILRIPASSSVCFGGGRLRTKVDDDTCNSNGVTFPRPNAFGVDIFGPVRITVAAGTTSQSPQVINSRINKSLVHEILWHSYYSLRGEPWHFTPQGLNADEVTAKFSLNPALHSILPDSNGNWPQVVPFVTE